MTLLKLRKRDLHWREIDGEIIALEARGSRYVAANGAGAVLWRALVVGTTRNGLAEELPATYGIERGVPRQTSSLLGALAEQALLAVRVVLD